MRPSRQRDADAARRHHDRGSRAWLPVQPDRAGVRGAVLPGAVPPRPAVPSARGRQALQQVRQELAVATIDLGSEEQIEVGLMSGEQVLLSRGQLEEKLRQLPVMRSVARSKGLDLAVYDMTVDRNYVGRPATWVDPAEGTEE